MNTPVESLSNFSNESQIEENLIKLANSNDTKGFLTLLAGLKNVDLTQIFDKKLYTCKENFLITCKK